MSALTANKAPDYRDGGTLELGVAANVHIFAGGMLEVDGSNVRPARKGANKVYLGVALQEADNTNGVAAAIKVSVRRQVAFRLAKTGAATLGATAYVVDDQTVTSVATGASKVGKIIDTQGDDVWVFIGAGA